MKSPLQALYDRQVHFTFFRFFFVFEWIYGHIVKFLILLTAHSISQLKNWDGGASQKAWRGYFFNKLNLETTLKVS